MLLRWEAVKELAEDEWYRVGLHYLDAAGDEQSDNFLVKETDWQVPTQYYSLINPDDRTLRWEVTLVLETAELAEEAEALPLSLPGETWSLYWR